MCDDEKIRSYLVSLMKKQGGKCSITEYASADAYFSDGKEHDSIFLYIEMGGSGAGLDGRRSVPVSGKARGRTEICIGVRTGGRAGFIRSRAAEEKLVIQLYLKSGNIEYYAKIGDLEEELAGQF